jgi:xylan 1,4-beta-xylosidase
MTVSLDRRAFLKSSALSVAAAAMPAFAQHPASIVAVTIDMRQVSGSLPHIWEECAGSDRAAITLRESWRRDLERWHTQAGLKRVRFHGIFNDELGVYAPSILNRGKSDAPNFQNVDQVYDGLLERGVSPFVELSFMPKRLASADRKFGFYAANISPPTSNEDWASFIRAFVLHLIDRYGLTAVRSWPFEVWNEPNLPFFWSGTQQQYFELYKATAVAIKSLDAGLQVGGPSTARAQWLPELAAYCEQNNAPIDFFSTHVYPGDDQAILFGEGAHFPLTEVIPEAMRRSREKIDATAFRGRPLWLTEWSSDSPAMIAHIISGCLPYCHAMSQWALSATFEELGVADYILKEGYGGWGMMSQGIAMPSFNTYQLLHALGTERLVAQGPVLATRRADRSVAALVWNLAEVVQPSGIPDQSHTRSVQGEAKQLQIEFAGARAGQRVQVRYVDQERGSAMRAWREMGSPQYIKPDQIQLLRQGAQISPATILKLDALRQLVIELPPEGVALVELI